MNDWFRGCSMNFVDITDGNGRKVYIPNRKIIRFDGGDCWCGSKTFVHQ